MKLADLNIGSLYRLTQDVKNPVCDKRSSNKFQRLPVFKEGMLMVCLGAFDAPALRRLHSTDMSITGQNSCRGFTAAIHREIGVERSPHDRDRAWAEAIVPHLEEIPIDSWDLMHRAYGGHAAVGTLQKLVEDGTVSLERVVEMMRRGTLGATPE